MSLVLNHLGAVLFRRRLRSAECPSRSLAALGRWGCLVVAGWVWVARGSAAVVINEIHYRPAENQPLEFVELLNAGDMPVNLEGWTLGKFEFVQETLLAPGGFAVVARNPEAFQKAFGFKPHGPLPAKLKHSGDEVILCNAVHEVVDRVRYRTIFPWPTAVAGGGSSLERVHPALPSDEPGSWRSSGYPDATLPLSKPSGGADVASKRPTPGATNSVFTPQPPPMIRAVEHRPAQPTNGQPVVVTARVATMDGLPTVNLLMQMVEPGAYVRRSDSAFLTNWLSLPMHDAGADTNAPLGGRVFTVMVPGDWQKHRWLVRYRIAATSVPGHLAQAPTADDECPNFAWYVYDGLPAWSGASQPGKTPALMFPAAMLGTLPAYHLLARREDVEHSQWDGGANRQRFLGTLVYDGRVYDHIQFHNRGQASAYNTGKNKWGFKFNRGHEFAARDAWGQLGVTPWHSLDLNACASPWVQMNRGMAGMDEALSFRAYQLAGVPSAMTHWLELRVVSTAAESNPRSQYEGDLWGLYLAVQAMNGPWLDAVGLPEGDIFSLQSGRKHAPNSGPADDAAWNHFREDLQRSQPVGWWRTNLDLAAFYSFHALNRLLANVDLREGANHGYYRHPDGRWAPIPWDVDMMFIPRNHQSGVIDANRCLDHPPLRLEFQNRAREILDLFASDTSTNGGQVGQLVAELSRMLCPSGSPRTWPELDEALWNYHPHSNTRGEFYVNPYDRGWSGTPFRRVLATPDFAGFCRYITEFCTDARPQKNYQPDDGNPQGYGYGFLALEAADPKIPAQPEIRYKGPEGFPAHQLAFNVSAYQSPAAARFVSIQWRIAEITAPGLDGYVSGQPQRYEIEPGWNSSELGFAYPVFYLPEGLCRPDHTYRIRARYEDETGRWSHWSAPVQFAPRDDGIKQSAETIPARTKS